MVDLRGNVPTRLRKVDDGQVHAAILAVAGLRRLEVTERIAAVLDAPGWLPAAGQGAVAVQVRAEDADAARALAALNDDTTMRAVTAERAFLAALDGGCQVPIGALVIWDGATETLHGLIADASGRRVIRGSHPVHPARPADAGEALAQLLRERGATAVLADMRGIARVPAPQPQ